MKSENADKWDGYRQNIEDSIKCDIKSISSRELDSLDLFLPFEVPEELKSKMKNEAIKKGAIGDMQFKVSIIVQGVYLLGNDDFDSYYVSSGNIDSVEFCLLATCTFCRPETNKECKARKNKEDREIARNIKQAEYKKKAKEKKIALQKKKEEDEIKEYHRLRNKFEKKLLK